MFVLLLLCWKRSKVSIDLDFQFNSASAVNYIIVWVAMLQIYFLTLCVDLNVAHGQLDTYIIVFCDNISLIPSLIR